MIKKYDSDYDEYEDDCEEYEMETERNKRNRSYNARREIERRLELKRLRKMLDDNDLGDFE